LNQRLEIYRGDKLSTLCIAVERLTEIPVKVVRLNFWLLDRILASGVLGIVFSARIYLDGMKSS